mmetsp:Transcript_20941/g.58493  ORF Transcript_20941/g.58493 Transcript_20941/m.58493 type:complete len:219 (-) Transcript_20941:323-979(-)
MVRRRRRHFVGHAEHLHHEDAVGKVGRGVLPAENFLPHQQPVHVAEVKKTRVLCVMRATDEVRPRDLYHLHVAQQLPVRQDRGVSHVVPIEAEEFHRLPVELNLRAARAHEAEAEADLDAVEQPPSRQKRDLEAVHGWTLWGPRPRPWDLHATQSTVGAHVVPAWPAAAIARGIVVVETPVVDNVQAVGGRWADDHIDLSQRRGIHLHGSDVQLLSGN